MFKIVLVLLYLYGGEVKLELQSAASMEDCMDKGNARVEVLLQDPKFDSGLFADCVPSLVNEAKK